MGVEILSISTDSRFSHKIWQAEELSKMVDKGVPYPMLSDAGGAIGKVYASMTRPRAWTSGDVFSLTRTGSSRPWRW
jgi:alkyl hydroperoxide reductase subunit AhpC